MDPQHDRVDEIFCRAADKATAQERSKYLDGACGDDPQLRARVERLLAAQSKVDSFLESPAPGAELGAEMGPTMADSGREPASSDRPLSEKPGTRIGPYKLLQKLGEGGMGVVYMAEQSEPVERRVALKIIKPGMDTRQVTARFEAERQALAMMDHPGIAHVLDAGTTESGRPFFAMELVKGVPITQYCDVKRLTLQQRLALFVDVCHAVQHAHQKGIIHRDIKPSNVMVAEYDDHAVPKVIDFGVAKAIQQQLTEKTMFTQMGQVVGTLEYMSPEQAKLNQMDIDTRSDIYSLGVLLYELLTGETPFDRQRLRSAAFDERLRIVREEEVLKPSTRLGSSEILPSVAANRHLEQRKLSAEVRGELDWIVMKAMEKERERRYPTAYEFAQDVRRFLADEPIQACSPSTVYRLRRFVRRNKRSVIAGACVSVSVILAAAFGLLAHLRSIEQANMRLMLIQANVAKRESDAKRLDAEVDALVEEAQRLCSGVFPDFHRAIELLDEAIIHRPSEGMLYFYRGNARYELGRYREAIADLNRSLEFVPADNQAAHWLLAHSFQQLGDRTSARMHLELAAAQQAEGVLPLVAAALAEPFEGRGIELLTEAIEQEPFNPLLYYYRGRIAYNLTLRNVSSQFYRIAIEDLEKAHRGRPTDLRIVETLCCCHVDFRFLDDSPQRSLARARALIDYWFAERSNDVGAFAALARWQLASDQPEEAVETCLSLSETSRSPLLLFQLGLAYRELAQHQQAVDAFSRAIQLDPELLGGGQSMAAIYAARSVSQFSLGRHELARHDLHQALEPSAQQTWTFFDWYSVVAAHRTLGDCDQGLVWCERFVESIPQCGQSWYLHGALLLDLGRQQEAQADFIKAIERNPHDHRPYDGLLGTYLSSRETEQAMIWCNRWVEFSPESNDAYRWRGLFHYHDKNYEPALRDLSKAVRLDPRDARSHYHRARTYLALKQYQEAAQDFDQSLQLDPSDTEVRLARARMQYDRGRYEMAVADYDAVLQRHSQDADVWWRRGETWRKLGRTEQALADLNKSLELDPHNATAYDRRGLVYAAFRRYSDAIADHKRALKLNPKEPWAHMHMVNAYLASGDDQAALEFCGQWMLDIPNSSEPHRLRAQVFYTSENYQAALSEFLSRFALDLSRPLRLSFTRVRSPVAAPTRFSKNLRDREALSRQSAPLSYGHRENRRLLMAAQPLACA